MDCFVLTSGMESTAREVKRRKKRITRRKCPSVNHPYPSIATCNAGPPPSIYPYPSPKCRNQGSARTTLNRTSIFKLKFDTPIEIDVFHRFVSFLFLFFSKSLIPFKNFASNHARNDPNWTRLRPLTGVHHRGIYITFSNKIASFLFCFAFLRFVLFNLVG